MNSNSQSPGSPHNLDGLLIAFEGIDGSGKTTMANRIVDHLNSKGHNSHYLREPTNGPHGRQLRQIMTQPGPRDPQKEFDLFIKDRREDVENNIKPLLQAGAIVCIDRYYISSMAYQGALGLDVDMIQKANEEFAPRPDLILYFDIPVETALGRIRTSRPEGANTFEQEDNLTRVTEIFHTIKFPELHIINATQPPDTVFHEILNLIMPHVKSPA